MKSAAVIALLKRKGWTVASQKGSHVHLLHPQHPGKVTVPHPKKDVPIGTLHSIWKQAGLHWPPELED